MKSSNWPKRLKEILIYLFLIFIILLSGSQGLGKEWTAEQNEVWATILRGWEDIKKGDVQSVMLGRHDKCLSLDSNNPTPFNNDQIRNTVENWLAGDYKPTFIKVEPIEILIVDNFAIIFYLFKWESDIGFKQKGRTMSTLIKQNNKWMLVGGMSASCDKPAPCPYGW